MRRAATAAFAALAAAVLPAAPAWGHAFYVDASAPAGGDCQPGNPCDTIAEAMAIPDPDPGSPDIVVVSAGTYTENVILGVAVPDRSLLASGPGAHTILPANAGQPTVEIGGPPSVVGFALGGPQPVLLSGPGRVSMNTFDSAAVPGGGASVTIAPGAGNAVIDRNAFSDDGAGTQVGLRSQSTGSPTIRQNTFTRMPTAVDLTAGTPVLDSNLVIDGATGVAASNATVSVLNLTAAGSSVADLALQSSSLTLTSSFLQRPIAADPASSCTIAYSAGPATSGGPCEAFQLPSAAPGFADPAGGDYRPAAGSPLIDAGDPALLSGIDLDGGSRVVDGNCDGAAVRDIGAYELAPECPPPADPPPPDPPPTDPPPPAGDTQPPETEITRKKVKGHAATFRFRSSEPGSNFACRLDGRPYRDCESPVRYRGLDRGRHSFAVRAIDVAGNQDPAPARARVRIR